jgi:hypothetical protein
LIAAPIEIGLPYYGLMEGSPASNAFGPGHEDYAYCCENAAMYISTKLLHAIEAIEAFEASRLEHAYLRRMSPRAALVGVQSRQPDEGSRAATAATM